MFCFIFLDMYCDTTMGSKVGLLPKYIIQYNNSFTTANVQVKRLKPWYMSKKQGQTMIHVQNIW